MLRLPLIIAWSYKLSLYLPGRALVFLLHSQLRQLDSGKVLFQVRSQAPHVLGVVSCLRPRGQEVFCKRGTSHL